jgi:protein SCO1
MERRPWLILSVAALCAALAGFWLARKLDSSAPQLASGTWLPQARQVADFHLVNEAGEPFSAAQLQGRPSLVFFGFTHCPDVCPTTLAKLAQVKKTGALPDLRVLLISIDPQRDTPPVLSQYVHAFDPRFIGLTGDTAAIGKVAADFGVAVQRVELPGGDYTMDHSATVFLLDNHAREVAVFTPPFDAKQIAQDLRTAAPDLEMSRAKTTLFDRLAKSAGPFRAGGDFLQLNKNG